MILFAPTKDGLWCAHESCHLDNDKDIGHDCCRASTFQCQGIDGCCADKLEGGIQVNGKFHKNIVHFICPQRIASNVSVLLNNYLVTLRRC